MLKKEIKNFRQVCSRFLFGLSIYRIKAINHDYAIKKNKLEKKRWETMGSLFVLGEHLIDLACILNTGVRTYFRSWFLNFRDLV